MTVNTTTTLYRNLPETTDESRKEAIRQAVQRELEPRELAWLEIKGMTLEDLLARNTDALVDDYHEYGDEMSAAELTGLLTAVKVGSEMLDTDYLSQCKASS